MKIRGIIWGNTLEKTKEELTRLKHNYLACHRIITHEVNSRLAGVVEFDDGDFWEARVPNEASRGIRCNISYVSRSIDPDLIDNIIAPCTSRPPFNALRYY